MKNGSLIAQKKSGIWLIDEASVSGRVLTVNKAGARPRRGNGKAEASFTLMNRTHEIAEVVYSTSRKEFTAVSKEADGSLQLV